MLSDVGLFKKGGVRKYESVLDAKLFIVWLLSLAVRDGNICRIIQKCKFCDKL